MCTAALKKSVERAPIERITQGLTMKFTYVCMYLRVPMTEKIYNELLGTDLHNYGSLTRHSSQGCLDQCWRSKSARQSRRETHEGRLEPPQAGPGTPRGLPETHVLFVPLDLLDEGTLQKLRPCVTLLNKDTSATGCRETKRSETHWKGRVTPGPPAASPEHEGGDQQGALASNRMAASPCLLPTLARECTVELILT